MAEHLFASFILDRQQQLEIAIAAESVIEATPITGDIQPLPGSTPFLEGVMHLRDAVIPILNLKKRLGFPDSSYNPNARIAVVTLATHHVGLLFEDIKEVLRVDESLLQPIHPALQSADDIISDLISLEHEQRTLEVLDLKKLFHDNSLFASPTGNASPLFHAPVCRTCSRYVIFAANGQEYGVPVENSREITYLARIDTTFQDGCMEGALRLRDLTIPVMKADALLHGDTVTEDNGQDSRILIMSVATLTFGIIVDAIVEILTVINEEILPIPARAEQSATGIYEPVPGRNIMLLDVDTLIADQRERLQSMARINTEAGEDEKTTGAGARHLITENCYLIFSIGKHYALEIKNVQEILEGIKLMSVPAATGFDSELLNLRGQIIPVLNLRQFYEYPPLEEENDGFKLIICQAGNQVVALKVDRIVTIYKQEQYFVTPSLNPQLQPKKDTLNHLIEFVGENKIKEHVLVVNTHNLIQYLRPDRSSVNRNQEYEEVVTESSSYSET